MKQTPTLVSKEVESCPYCGGVGYFQLLLGGSETCDHCKGNGQTELSIETNTNTQC